MPCTVNFDLLFEWLLKGLSDVFHFENYYTTISCYRFCCDFFVGLSSSFQHPIRLFWLFVADIVSLNFSNRSAVVDLVCRRNPKFEKKIYLTLTNSQTKIYIMPSDAKKKRDQKKKEQAKQKNLNSAKGKRAYDTWLFYGGLIWYQYVVAALFHSSLSDLEIY